MDKKVIKSYSMDFAINCNSAKEINSKVKDLQILGIDKETSLEIIKTAKEIRKNRLDSIKSQVNGQQYDGIKTLSVIFSKEYNSKDWKEIAKNNTTFAKVESLESFLLSYYPFVSVSGKLVIVSKDKVTKETTNKERNLARVNAISVWNRCISNVLRETKDGKKLQTVFEDSEILSIEKQEEIKKAKNGK